MKGLEIDKASWHAQVYFWALGVWFKFKGYKEIPDHWRREGNLCLYIRTLTVWLPLTFALHILFGALVVFTFVKLPIALFGMVLFVESVIGLVIFAGLGWALARGGARISRWINRRRNNQPKEARRKPQMRPVVGPVVEAVFDTGMSFFELIVEWLVAQKKKICPKINFVSADEQRTT